MYMSPTTRWPRVAWSCNRPPGRLQDRVFSAASAPGWHGQAQGRRQSARSLPVCPRDAGARRGMVLESSARTIAGPCLFRRFRPRVARSSAGPTSVGPQLARVSARRRCKAWHGPRIVRQDDCRTVSFPPLPPPGGTVKRRADVSRPAACPCRRAWLPPAGPAFPPVSSKLSILMNIRKAEFGGVSARAFVTPSGGCRPAALRRKG